MFTKAIRFVRSISESAKNFSYAAHKTTIFNGLALMVTCGIGAALPTPAQAASFTGFGCIDDPACQSYLAFWNAHISGSSFSPEFVHSVPDTRISASVSGLEIADSFLRSESYGSASGSASIETVLGLGTLKGKAEASALAIATDDGGLDARGNAMVYLGWGDTITVTSNSHLPGAKIPFEVRLYLDRFVSASGRYEGNTQASVYANLSVHERDLSHSSISDLHIFDTNFFPSNITEVTTIAYLPVGELSIIQGQLWLGASAEAYASFPNKPYEFDRSIADASHTANYYLTPLLDGVSYTSASGKTYFYSPPVNKVPEPTSPLSFVGLVGLGFAFLSKRRNCTERNEL
ncbi:PEP-CTERM sorting domain-containing protein [Aerosakkonemataceae cyanobacterium BLCC-F154]|uniref:PEP-CTERM sorting domain-containing protein n=1 Tax=Floridaenema fluviatile BLCC-F154 TaxID=3153640 RepID=A0ABV4YHN1_9CYAN